LRISGSGGEVARFGINTTPVCWASSIPRQMVWPQGTRDDFGLTLRYYRVPTGPYLMLPLLGPSTAADTVGLVADGFMSR